MGKHSQKTSDGFPTGGEFNMSGGNNGKFLFITTNPLSGPVPYLEKGKAKMYITLRKCIDNKCEAPKAIIISNQLDVDVELE